MKNIKVLFNAAMDIMNELGIEVGIITDVKWNTRLKAVWGRCVYSGQTKTYRIELNTILSDEAVSWNDAMNTMIHEVLHAHKNRMCHTGEWKYYAHLINMEYPIYHIERCTSAEDKNAANIIERKYKYIIKCRTCGAESMFQREGKLIKLIRTNPNSCRCDICGNHSFDIIEN